MLSNCNRVRLTRVRGPVGAAAKTDPGPVDSVPGVCSSPHPPTLISFPYTENFLPREGSYLGPCEPRGITTKPQVPGPELGYVQELVPVNLFTVVHPHRLEYAGTTATTTSLRTPSSPGRRDP